jgi:hypothetical protein
VITFFPWFLSGGDWDYSQRPRCSRNFLMVDEADDAPFEFAHGSISLTMTLSLSNGSGW